MKAEFWHARWHENRIGFHQSEINRFLLRHAAVLGTSGPVFVPLCGKSRDMAWLAEQGRQVVGIEISPLAVEAFFREQNIPVDRVGRGEYLEYRSTDITILLGDYFRLTAELLGPVAAVYDRAALIAMPPAMRPAYAEQMARLLAPGTPVLLIAPFSPKDAHSGPPFPVSSAEIQEIFAGHFTVEVLECERKTPEDDPQLAEQGLAWREEGVYRLCRRG
ncbi:thiopurine S-methyltransferase [Acidiferrobacter sp.]|uniref:thiopurine S-methyltransferase n=1 Tax=Acidiferrobacter sp. TaxID=1872107 RepID=UPI0026177385|nr:thiopurine S-methyltransferase [Acidiferrobacter sp.]